MPFEDDDEEIAPARKGLKTTNQNSSVLAASSPKANFDKDAEEVFNRSEDYKRRAAECAKAYLVALKDKTLPDNKNSISKDLEKESFQNLIQLGMEMNSDLSQDDGVGSMALIALLLRVILTLRDQVNLVDYRVVRVEASIDALTKLVESLGKSRDDKKVPTE
jgi:hypothetical protein